MPLFLARSGYRSRRLSDAARAMPVLGLFLLLVPILWSDSAAGSEQASTADVGIYLFLVWALLIVVAALLAPRLPVSEPERTPDARDGRE